MNDTIPPTDDRALLVLTERTIAETTARRKIAIDTLAELDSKQTALGHHPHHAGYVAGGMLLERGFGKDHILAVLGMHALDWRDTLDRLDSAPVDAEDSIDLLYRLRSACQSDPMLEVVGTQLAGELGLLKHGRIDPFWLKRPKFGLGQAAMVFGVEPQHADCHRGLYALPLAVLRRGFVTASALSEDQRFGALLLPVIQMGGERLARIGAAAFHCDAEARYQDDCARFAAHQRTHPDRRWRWKPPLSRQGHLAVTTAQMLGTDLSDQRTRGHAANWLGDHDANLRFAKPEA